MSKTLYFQSAAATTHRGDNTAKLAGATSWWEPRLLAEARGSGAASATGASVAGTTVGIEFVNGTVALEWLSEPLSADFTIAGTITGNLWGFESTMNDNTAINFVVDKIDGATGAITQIAKSARTTELGTASAVNSFTVAPTSTACKRGDRLRIRPFIDDAGAAMIVGTTTFRYNGATAAADGDSFVTFTENLTFEGTALLAQTDGGFGSQSIGDISARTKIAQPFVVPTGQNTLGAVAVTLTKFGTPADNVVFEIQTDNAGQPSGTVVGSVGTQAASSLPTSPTTATINLSCNIALVAGQTYHLVISRSGALDAANFAAFFMSSATPPAGWSGYVPYNGTAWAASSTRAVQVTFTFVLTTPTGSTYYLTDTARNGSSYVEQTLGTPNNLGNITVAMEAAESFVAAGTLTEVRLTLSKVGSPADNLIVEVQTDSGDSPSGAVVGTVATVSMSTFTTTATQYTYSCSIALTAKTKYWVVLRRSGAVDAANYFRVNLCGSPDVLPWGHSAYRGSGTWTAQTQNLTCRITPASDPTKAARTTRGGGSVTAVGPTAAGPTAPIQVLDVSGGAAVEWYTPALEAVTLGGKAKVNIRALESNAAANASLCVQIAVVNGDGSGAVVWGKANIEPVTGGGEIGTADAAYVAWVAGDDLAITAGQRIRFRLFVEDPAIGPLVTGHTVTVTYGGTSAAAAGDTYVTLPVAVTEQSTGPWSKVTGANNGGADFTAAASVAKALPGAIAVGDLVVVAVSRSCSSNDLASDTCADSLGNVYTRRGGGFEAVDLGGLSWFTAVATVAGTPTVTVTFPNSQPNRAIAVQVYRSAAGVPSFDVASSLAVHSDIAGPGPDNLIAGSVTPTQNGDLVVAGFGQFSNLNTFSAGTGFTEDQDTGTAFISYLAIESLAQTTAASVQGLGTDSGSAARYLGFVAAFKGAGVTTHSGAATVSLTDTRVTAATRKTFSAAAVALTDTRVTNAVRKALAAAAVALVDAITTAAVRKVPASAAVALVDTVTTAARRVHVAAATAALVNARTTAATVTGKSGAAVALVDARTTAARVTMKSGATVALTDTRVTNAVRVAAAAASAALVNARTTAARVTMKSATTAPLVVSTVTAARRVLVGVASVALTNLRTTAARITARSAAPRPETVTVTTNGVSGAGATTYFGSATVALTDSRVTNATRTTYSASTVTLTNVRVTAARVTFRGAAVVALTNSRTTVAVRRANASASAQLANVRVTAARLTAKSTAIARGEIVTVTTNGVKTGVKLGAATVSLTDARTTNGVRKTFSAATVSLANVRVTGAVRKVFATVSRVEVVAVSTNGTASAGAVTHLGAVTVALTDVRLTNATRRVLATVTATETATVTTRGARVWFGAVSRVEAVTVTTAATSRANAAASVQLRALVFTSAENVVPLPPGRIDFTDIGQLANGRTGRIARTVTHA